MNIFVLHQDPKIAARMLCDNHVCKMVVESAQMLCAIFPDGKAPYKRSYYHHPCTVWTRTCFENYVWHLNHAHEIAWQYEIRYNRENKASRAIDWCSAHFMSLNLPVFGQIAPFAQAMPAHHKDPCAVQAYRSYYADKRVFARWRRGVTHPAWWPYPNETQMKITYA